MSRSVRLEDVIQAALREHAERGLTAVPGRVMSFNSSTQLASVQLVLSNGYDTPNGTVEHSWPIIPKVPIMFPGSGEYRITFPVKRNDFVLVIISSLPLDKWLATGGVSLKTEIDPLNMNDVSSAFAIPGLFPALEQKPPGPAIGNAMTVYSPGDINLGGLGASDHVLKGESFLSSFAIYRAAIKAAFNAITPGAGDAIDATWSEIGVKSDKVKVE